MPSETTEIVCSGPKTPLLALSEAIQTRLPRELRDTIYAYVFDPDTMRVAHDSIFRQTKYRSLSADPIWTSPQEWLTFLQPTHVEDKTRVELVEYFSKHNTNLEARGRHDLATLLARDLFGTGIRLYSVAIPALAVHLGKVEDMDISHMEDQWKWFEPSLLHGGQKFANNFVLEIHLSTNCIQEPTGPGSAWADLHLGRVKALVNRLRKTYPVVRRIREEMATKIPEITTVAMLDFKARHQYPEFVAEISEEALGWDDQEWVYHLRPEVRALVR